MDGGGERERIKLKDRMRKRETMRERELEREDGRMWLCSREKNYRKWERITESAGNRKESLISKRKKRET